MAVLSNAVDAEVSFITNSLEEKRLALKDFKPGAPRMGKTWAREGLEDGEAVPFNALLTKLHIPNVPTAFLKLLGSILRL